MWGARDEGRGGENLGLGVPQKMCSLGMAVGRGCASPDTNWGLVARPHTLWVIDPASELTPD